MASTDENANGVFFCLHFQFLRQIALFGSNYDLQMFGYTRKNKSTKAQKWYTETMAVSNAIRWGDASIAKQNCMISNRELTRSRRYLNEEISVCDVRWSYYTVWLNSPCRCRPLRTSTFWVQKGVYSIKRMLHAFTKCFSYIFGDRMERRARGQKSSQKMRTSSKYDVRPCRFRIVS